MEMLDFSSCPHLPSRVYGGANGAKIGVLYEGEPYLLKFAPHAKKNPKLHYANAPQCEYLGSHILASLGLRVHQTLLGLYQGKTVVACKDFTLGYARFFEFAALKNSVLSLDSSGYDTDLEDIQATFDSQRVYPQAELRCSRRGEPTF